MSDEPRKRSRFDQTEPERRSRFDRRSRSPSARHGDTRRSRSPIESSKTSSSQNPAAAAAAAAAKINAQIQAKKGVQHVEVPPIRSSSTPLGARSPDDKSSSANGGVYQQDGDYIRDIEVNDLRNRYTLTKGATQKMIKDDTGADVTTRGSYYPDKSMATPSNPPLYLHVTSTTKEGLEAACQKIEELMQQELPNLIDERRFRRREPEQVERDELGRRKWPEEHIPIDLEPIPGFNLRAQVVGHGGAYVKHIQNETRCRVQIKGRGSGFTERDTGVESDEPMYLHVAGPDANDVKRARELCEDLLTSVREQYQAFKERSSQRRENNYGGNDYGNGNRGGYGGHRDSPVGGGGAGGYGGHGGGQQSPYNAPPAAASAMSPTTSTPGAANPQDYQAQYAQYYQNAAQNGQDPYAAYGGYQAYYQMYMQYYQQQMAQGGQEVPGATDSPAAGAYAGAPPPPPPGASSAPGAADYGAPPPPPPPSSSDAPPPPPGSSLPAGGYNAVPPPPGMS